MHIFLFSLVPITLLHSSPSFWSSYRKGTNCPPAHSLLGASVPAHSSAILSLPPHSPTATAAGSHSSQALGLLSLSLESVRSYDHRPSLPWTCLSQFLLLQPKVYLEPPPLPPSVVGTPARGTQRSCSDSMVSPKTKKGDYLVGMLWSIRIFGNV